jgi:hypothetical protein
VAVVSSRRGGGVITDTGTKVDAPLRVGGDVKARSNRVEPHIEVARKARIGTVDLVSTIRKNGDVRHSRSQTVRSASIAQRSTRSTLEIQAGNFNGQPVDRFSTSRSISN